MIGIHPVHRRLTELTDKAESLGGYHRLSSAEGQELRHCLIVNAKLVRDLDQLKNLAFIAHVAGDMDWQQDICARIDKLEVSLI